MRCEVPDLRRREEELPLRGREAVLVADVEGVERPDGHGPQPEERQGRDHGLVVEEQEAVLLRVREPGGEEGEGKEEGQREGVPEPQAPSPGPQRTLPHAQR